MNMRTTLMLMAATMAPIYAQEPAESTAQTYARLAAPVTAPATTPSQRAAVYPSLAYIPADAEVILTINNISEIAGTFAKAIGETDGMPEEFTLFDALTIATGKGTQELLSHAAAIYAEQATEEEDYIDFFEEWAETTTPASAIIRKQTEAYLANLKAQSITSIKSIKVPTIYGIITTKSGGEAMLSQWLNNAFGEMTENIENDDPNKTRREVYDKNGYKGLKITLKGEDMVDRGYEFDPESGELKKLPLTETQQLIRETVDGRVIYAVMKQEGNRLISIITENEADLTLPTDVTQSILASDKLACADANLSKNPYMLSYAAPGINAKASEIQMAPIVGLGKQLVTGIFTELAAQPGENQAVWAAAAKASTLLCNTLSSLILPECPMPDIMQIWAENNTLQIQYDGNTQGATYQPGKLSLTAQPDKPGTILYYESTPWSYNINADCDSLIDAVVSLTEGFVATLPADAQAEATPQIAMAKQFLPDVKALLGSIKTISSGMGNSTALTIDSAGSMPIILGGTPGNKTAIPRICLYSGVTDRSKLAEGWQQLLTTAANIATKVGSDPSVINMLPIVPAVKGNATSYTVAMPWFTPDMVPNVTVSDTAFTAGTSSNYNAEIAAAATGDTPFAGCVMTVKFAPLATTARGIAKELRAIADAESKPVALEDAPADTEDEEEDYLEEDYYIDEEDYEERDYYSPRRSPAEERADSAEELADALEAAAKVVDRIDCTSTINNGTHTMRVQITPNN